MLCVISMCVWLPPSTYCETLRVTVAYFRILRTGLEIPWRERRSSVLEDRLRLRVQVPERSARMIEEWAAIVLFVV